MEEGVAQQVCPLLCAAICHSTQAICQPLHVGSLLKGFCSCLAMFDGEGMPLWCAQKQRMAVSGGIERSASMQRQCGGLAHLQSARVAVQSIVARCTENAPLLLLLAELA